MNSTGKLSEIKTTVKLVNEIEFGNKFMNIFSVTMSKCKVWSIEGVTVHVHDTECH